jgi:hypothetical protein
MKMMELARNPTLIEEDNPPHGGDIKKFWESLPIINHGMHSYFLGTAEDVYEDPPDKPGTRFQTVTHVRRPLHSTAPSNFLERVGWRYGPNVAYPGQKIEIIPLEGQKKLGPSGPSVRRGKGKKSDYLFGKESQKPKEVTIILTDKAGNEINRMRLVAGPSTGEQKRKRALIDLSKGEFERVGWLHDDKTVEIFGSNLPWKLKRRVASSRPGGEEKEKPTWVGTDTSQFKEKTTKRPIVILRVVWRGPQGEKETEYFHPEDLDQIKELIQYRTAIPVEFSDWSDKSAKDKHWTARIEPLTKIPKGAKDIVGGPIAEPELETKKEVDELIRSLNKLPKSKQDIILAQFGIESLKPIEKVIKSRPSSTSTLSDTLKKAGL